MLSIKLCNPLPLWLLRKLVLEMHAQRTRFACLIRLRLDYSPALSHQNGNIKKHSECTHNTKRVSARRWSESFLCVHYIKKPSTQKNKLLLCFFFVRNLSSLKRLLLPWRARCHNGRAECVKMISELRVHTRTHGEMNSLLASTHRDDKFSPRQTSVM